ncbi:MAG: permease-like cell division protein FtsX [Patescibacteria group bacterium]
MSKKDKEVKEIKEGGESEIKSGKTKRVKVGVWLNTWRQVRRSPFQSLAAVIVMWFNFLTASILVFLFLALSSLLGYFEARPEVIAFLKDEVDSVQVEQLKQKLSGVDGVTEVKFFSKDDALKIYREQNKDKPFLLEMVSARILPASLEVSAKDPSYLLGVAELIKGEKDLVEDVVFHQDVVELLSFWVKVLRNGGLGLVFFFSLVSLVMMVLILGMKISAQRDSIRALRSLGASDSYIQSPFLLEGMIYGFTGASFGMSLVFGFWLLVRSRAYEFFAPIVLIPKDPILLLSIVGIEWFLGIGLGLTAAWLASRRYLKK